MLVTQRGTNRFVSETRHVLSQRGNLSVLRTGEAAQIMGREILSPNIFGSPLERVIENPVVEMTATASRCEQQRIWTSRNILS
jgi:hypothetical protein